MKKLFYYKDLCIILILTAISLLLGLYFKTIGSSIFAIILGLITTQFMKKRNQKLVNITLKKALNTTIILLGFSININLIISLGFKTLLLVLLTIVLVITLFYFLAKLFKFSHKFSLLFAIGNAICGSSAIMSSNNYLKAKSQDFNLSVSIVNVMGLILMFSFPLIFNLFHHSVNQNGFIIGSTIQSVAQVLGASSIAGAKYVYVATLVKMTRVFMLIFVLLGLGWFTKKSFLEQENSKVSIINKISSILPLFLILFIVAIIITNLFKIPVTTLNIIKEIAHFLETLSLVCIGYQIILIDLVKQFKNIFLLIIISLIIQLVIAQILATFI